MNSQNHIKSLSAFMLPHKELSAMNHTTHHSLTSNTLWVKFFITLGESIPHVRFHVVKFWKFKMSNTRTISVFRNSYLMYLPFHSIVSREDLCYLSRNIFRRLMGCLKADVITLILWYEISWLKRRGKMDSEFLAHVSFLNNNYTATTAKDTVINTPSTITKPLS